MLNTNKCYVYKYKIYSTTTLSENIHRRRRANSICIVKWTPSFWRTWPGWRPTKTSWARGWTASRPASKSSTPGCNCRFHQWRIGTRWNLPLKLFDWTWTRSVLVFLLDRRALKSIRRRHGAHFEFDLKKRKKNKIRSSYQDDVCKIRLSRHAIMHAPYSIGWDEVASRNITFPSLGDMTCSKFMIQIKHRKSWTIFTGCGWLFSSAPLNFSGRLHS